MDSYALALNIAIPFFTLLILIEYIYGRAIGFNTTNVMDTVSSLSSGITNITKDVLGLSIAILSYGWVESKIGIFDMKAEWYVFLLAFIGKDFAGYWVHRINHKVNFFWNRHIVHHSSEEYNLPCALRQSISEIFTYSIIFLLPIAILGVPLKVYAIVAPIHLFAQFWYHTRHIGRMGIFEKIIVTPSHHRVHHAINPEYIDKNFSQIFIFWDKLFGTFQEEMDDVPAVYGVKKAVRTWNPILINWQHAWLVITDAWRANSWWDKARVWFMPTGWRPADVAEKYPIDVIEDVYTQEKYNPKASNLLRAWSIIQMVMTLVLSLYLFNRIGSLSLTEIMLYGAFIFVSVFSYTTLMDRKSYAWALEAGKAAFGIGLIWYFGDWFLINDWVAGGKFIVIGYLALSVAIVVAFVQTDISKDNSEASSNMQASAA